MTSLDRFRCTQKHLNSVNLYYHLHTRKACTFVTLLSQVIQWLLEKGINKYVCLERYMPFKYCANGRDLEVILYGESSRAPIQTTVSGCRAAP